MNASVSAFDLELVPDFRSNPWIVLRTNDGFTGSHVAVYDPLSKQMIFQAPAPGNLFGVHIGVKQVYFFTVEFPGRVLLFRLFQPPQ